APTVPPSPAPSTSTRASVNSAPSAPSSFADPPKFDYIGSLLSADSRRPSLDRRSLPLVPPSSSQSASSPASSPPRQKREKQVQLQVQLPAPRKEDAAAAEKKRSSVSASPKRVSGGLGRASRNSIGLIPLPRSRNSDLIERPTSPPVRDPEVALDFEKLLLTMETKKMSSTPERMKEIEVKSSTVRKLEAKSATTETDTSYLRTASLDDDDDIARPRAIESHWAEFLKNTGPEDVGLASRPPRVLSPTASRQTSKESISSKSPNPSSILIASPSPVRAAPVQHSRASLLATRSLDSSIDDSRRREPADSDDELFGSTAKPRPEISLAEFLSTTEPPRDNAAYGYEPVDAKRGKRKAGGGLKIFSLTRKGASASAAVGDNLSGSKSASLPRAGKKYVMIHVPATASAGIDARASDNAGARALTASVPNLRALGPEIATQTAVAASAPDLRTTTPVQAQIRVASPRPQYPVVVELTAPRRHVSLPIQATEALFAEGMDPIRGDDRGAIAAVPLLPPTPPRSPPPPRPKPAPPTNLPPPTRASSCIPAPDPSAPAPAIDVLLRSLGALDPAFLALADTANDLPRSTTPHPSAPSQAPHPSLNRTTFATQTEPLPTVTAAGTQTGATDFSRDMEAQTDPTPGTADASVQTLHDVLVVETIYVDDDDNDDDDYPYEDPEEGPNSGDLDRFWGSAHEADKWTATAMAADIVREIVDAATDSVPESHAIASELVAELVERATVDTALAAARREIEAVTAELELERARLRASEAERVRVSVMYEQLARLAYANMDLRRGRHARALVLQSSRKAETEGRDSDLVIRGLNNRAVLQYAPDMTRPIKKEEERRERDARKASRSEGQWNQTSVQRIVARLGPHVVIIPRPVERIGPGLIRRVASRGDLVDRVSPPKRVLSRPKSASRPPTLPLVEMTPVPNKSLWFLLYFAAGLVWVSAAFTLLQGQEATFQLVSEGSRVTSSWIRAMLTSNTKPAEAPPSPKVDPLAALPPPPPPRFIIPASRRPGIGNAVAEYNFPLRLAQQYNLTFIHTPIFCSRVSEDACNELFQTASLATTWTLPVIRNALDNGLLREVILLGEDVANVTDIIEREQGGGIVFTLGEIHDDYVFEHTADFWTSTYHRARAIEMTNYTTPTDLPYCQLLPAKMRDPRLVHIAIHVRHGDILRLVRQHSSDKHALRFLPNRYFITILNDLQSLLPADLTTLTVFTDGEARKVREIVANFPGQAMVLAASAADSGTDSLKALAAADILIGSKSGFTQLAALLSGHSVKVVPRWYWPSYAGIANVIDVDEHGKDRAEFKRNFRTTWEAYVEGYAGDPPASCRGRSVEEMRKIGETVAAFMEGKKHRTRGRLLQ
ncbi:hypothetical protein BDK51DRAFT_48978, partial [Blyttiomyces helicus]